MSRRWLVFGLALLVFLAAVVFRWVNREGAPTIDRGGPAATASDEEPTGPSSPSAAPTSRASPSPAPTTSTDPAALLTDPDAAETATVAELRAAVGALVDDATVVDDWRAAVASQLQDWPVATGTATIDANGEVDFDVVFAGLASTGERTLVLRAVAASTALGDTGFTATASVGGTSTPVTVDRDGARLTVDLPADDGAPVRVTGSYTLPDLAAIPRADGPAGFGLLARSTDVWALGHWLPVATLPSDAGPMLARGDVGAFPTAAWSVLVRHPHSLVSGGDEAACPDPAPDCTWVRAVGLRDISAAVVADVTTAAESADGPADAGVGATAGVRVEAHAPAVLGGGATAAVAELAADMTWALGTNVGGLPWPEIDVVPVAFNGGAAGMEFPGMIWVDRDDWNTGGFARYVVAHEIGHQWFHALVGNGSISAPVVDESLAQYAAYLVFAELYGDAEATALAQRAFAGRHESALADGVPDDAPAQPLDAFSSDRSYGSAVYGRGAQAWVDAEQAAGRQAVVDVLQALVQRHALGVVDEADVLAVADEVAPEVAAVLREGWGV